MPVVTDAGATDAGTVDSGVIDAGVTDSGIVDGGSGGPAPQFLSTPSTTAHCGIPYRYSGARVPEVRGSGPFTFTVDAGSGATLPEGLTVDSVTGELSWTPTSPQVGTHALVLRVANAAGQDTQAFSVVVECPEVRELPIGCGCTSADGALWSVLLLVTASLRSRNRSRRG